MQAARTASPLPSKKTIAILLLTLVFTSCDRHPNRDSEVQALRREIESLKAAAAATPSPPPPVAAPDIQPDATQATPQDLALMKSNGMSFTGKFFGAVEGRKGVPSGSLLEVKEFNFADSEIGGYKSRSEFKVVFVLSLPSQPDGEHWQSTIYPTGRMLTLGGNTYRVFATQPEDAVKAAKEKQVIDENPSHWLSPDALDDYKSRWRKK